MTFTATVTGPGGTPTGSVTFYDGASSLGSNALASGTATLSTSALTAGSHSISAVYSGDANYATSTSATLSQLVSAPTTYVSGAGVDSGGCQRDAPCQTFAYALSVTTAGGEIDCIDHGGFGTVTINKPITIDCGALGSILSSGTDGIVIAGTPAASAVTIRNLSINGTGGGLNGIRYLSGSGALHLENVKIFGFTQRGIDFENTAPANLFVRSSQISDNLDPTNGGGILVKPSGGVLANVSLYKVRLDRNKYGLRVEDGVKATVTDSVAHANANNGFLAVSSGVAARINLIHSVVSNTLVNGVATSGALATITLYNSTITANGTGINTSGGGTVTGTNPDTNLNVGNATPGAPTANVTLQ